MATGISTIKNSVTKRLDAMVNAPNLVEGYLNRVVLRQYLTAQQKRWDTHNVGDEFQGGEWAELDPKYKAWKLKKYGTDEILIRTRDLINSSLLKNSMGMKTVDTRGIHIYTKVPYAPYMMDGTTTTKKRYIDLWSDSFMARIKQGIGKYVSGAKK
jgi:hypothetical protein